MEKRGMKMVLLAQKNRNRMKKKDLDPKLPHATQATEDNLMDTENQPPSAINCQKKETGDSITPIYHNEKTFNDIENVVKGSFQASTMSPSILDANNDKSETLLEEETRDPLPPNTQNEKTLNDNENIVKGPLQAPTMSPSILGDNNKKKEPFQKANGRKSKDDSAEEDFSATDSDEYKPPKRKIQKIIPSRSSSSSSSDESSPDNDKRALQAVASASQKNTKKKITIPSNSRSLSSSSSCSSSSSSSSNDSALDYNTSADQPEKLPKTKKRIPKPNNWIKNKKKLLKNSGKEYISRTGKNVEARTMGPVCNCRLLCANKFPNEKRIEVFDTYWEMGSMQRQRDFLNSCIMFLDVSYRRVKVSGRARRPNCAFYLINNGRNVRVCKKFLLNTLGIAERTLRTVIEAKNEGTGVVPVDKRGRHANHLKLDEEIIQSVRNHINSYQRIESHYVRANTSREYIDGGLTVAEMQRNYEKLREEDNKVAANYDAYSRIFNNEFNISFFIPKKDQCDECEGYKNASQEERAKLEENYEKHHDEKRLSRIEKKNDIQECHTTESNTIVATYDLQAVLPCPIGKSSAFYYKSKLNCYNFTISDRKNLITSCYFWHEGLGTRGAIEIGTCVFKFLQEVAAKKPDSDIIFYSDNCCGQQKNRFILGMYYYAVATLPLKSITHKFLIRGHTQNEGDTAHSTIEQSIKRAKRAGPIYVPDQYVALIRQAKKTGSPFIVNEMNYDDFYDLKSLTDEIGLNTTKNVNGDRIKLTEIKVLKFMKDRDIYQYKTSYRADWIDVKVNIGRATNKKKIIEDINIKPAYSSKIRISGRKKEDLLQLLQTNIVPKYYEGFFKNLF